MEKQIIIKRVEESHKDHTDNNGYTDNKLSIHMPFDVISLEILSRLSVQSIFKFRSVCKHWNSLPLDAKFVETHLEQSSLSNTTSFKILICYNTREAGKNIYSLYTLDIRENYAKPKLVFRFSLDMDLSPISPASCDNFLSFSCDGLISFSGSDRGNNKRHQIYVCNPSTHEFMRIPLPNSGWGKYGNRADRLFTFAGFGFDKVTKKYKVLCGFYTLTQDTRKRFIFTLGSANDGWRQVDDIPYLINRCCMSAYLDGQVHWITKRLEGILSFNFEDEKYNNKLLPLPNTSFRDCKHSDLSLIATGGYLHLIIRQITGVYWTFHCWKLNDLMNEQVWTYEKADFENVATLTDLDPFPLSMQNGSLWIVHERKLYRYNLKSHVLQEIDLQRLIPVKSDFNSYSWYWPKEWYWPNFVESLRSFDHSLGYHLNVC